MIVVRVFTWLLPGLDLCAGNLAFRYRRQDGIDDGVEPWEELIRARNVHANYGHSPRVGCGRALPPRAVRWIGEVMRSEQDRQAIFESLCRGLGAPAAEFVMELFDRSERLLLAQEGGAAALRGEMAEARGETRALAASLRGEMATLASELRAEMAKLASELRGEMAEVRGEMRSLLPKFLLGNLAMMVALVTAVITAGALL